jgi:hypothetical protein
LSPLEQNNMATSASWLDGDTADGGSEMTRVAPPRKNAFVVRPLPNEDVALWIKSIDNSRVAPQKDPRVRNACWRLITISSLSVAVVVGLLLPSAYGLLASYQLQTLDQEQRELLKERELLKLEVAKRESPQQLEEWAEAHGLKQPPPTQVVYLQPADDGSLALNVSR